jgi:long-chain acyl-CoA synthetase
MSLNLAVILEESTKRNPDKVALIFDDFKLTYSQLNAAANQVANALTGAGIKAGDRVGMMLPNVPQFPIIYFGILKAGGVVVPMNVLLKGREVAYYLSDSEASAFFFWDMFSGDAIAGATEAPSVKKLIQVGIAPGEAPAGGEDFFAFMGTQAPTFDTVATRPTTPA